MTTTSLVLHVPHASTYIPDWVYDECFLPREARGQVARKKALDIAFELEMMTIRDMGTCTWRRIERHLLGLFQAGAIGSYLTQ